jgi:MFS family permease
MVFSIFGLYLYNMMGVSLKKIGLLDGVIECIAFSMKLLSGLISDFFMNRKILLCIGTSFLFLAKPLEAIATTFWHLFSAKIIERFGNGIQSTPRDALVANLAPPHMKGACFGLRQTMAASGSVFGAISSYFLLKFSNEDYQFVFWIASIPSFLGFSIALFFVKEKEISCSERKRSFRKISLSDIKNLGTSYWLLMIIAGAFMFSKVSETIVILYSVKTLNLPSHFAPLCMLAFQVANSFSSYPLGKLSDKLKLREDLFLIGVAVFLLSDLLFVFASGVSSIVLSLLLFGIYVGISQTIFHAKIIDIIPKDLKGTGIGIFNLVCAISLLIGGNFMGSLSDKYGMKSAFVASSFLSALSIIPIVLSRRLCFKQSSQRKFI